MELSNRKLSDDQFASQRKEVLGQWPTGDRVDFDEAVLYHKSMPECRRFPDKLAGAEEKGITLVQPRAGVPLVDRHIELMQYLAGEGEADLLPTTVDSYTRQNRYAEAENGIEESKRQGKALLNGFPIVNYGVDICRRVIESVDIPIQVRHGTPDARLLAEISLAGGFTSYEGGGISYNIPYAKNADLEKTIADWQYCDRLAGLYQEAGVTINREPFGPLTGTLVPPFVSHSVAVIESLLAAEQGCTDITVGYGQLGNLNQDVAALLTLGQITKAYLERGGYKGVRVTTVFHQWMGGFPADESRAFGVISWGSAAAVMAGATKIIAKSPHEAVGIPTKEANAQGIKCTKQLITMLQDQKMRPNDILRREMEVILAETSCVVDKVFELGGGDIARGAVAAFKAGVLDIPFAPSRANAGKLLPARDNDGAVRLMNPGASPLSKDLLDFHKDMMNRRAEYEKRSVCYQMVIDDIYAISKGRLVGRPRSI